MKSEELAFYNQQLASMLKSGLPLEGALAELSRDLQKGPLKRETDLLVKDLAQGSPLADAINKRSFPSLYKRLVNAGAKSGQLNQILILLADHYHRSSLLWSRFRSVSVYPILVLLTAFLVSSFLAYSFTELYTSMVEQFSDIYISKQQSGFVFGLYRSLIILSPAIFGVLLLIALALVCIPKLRQMARWHLPGFREASLAQTAAACATLTKGGLTLDKTFDFLQFMEPHARTKQDLTRWREQLSNGESDFAAIAKGSRSFPPLFIWLIASSGESIAEGFEKAAVLYGRRADYRSNLFMVAAVPVSLLFTVTLLILQIFPMIQSMTTVLDALGGI